MDGPSEEEDVDELGEGADVNGSGQADDNGRVRGEGCLCIAFHFFGVPLFSSDRISLIGAYGTS